MAPQIFLALERSSSCAKSNYLEYEYDVQIQILDTRQRCSCTLKLFGLMTYANLDYRVNCEFSGELEEAAEYPKWDLVTWILSMLNQAPNLRSISRNQLSSGISGHPSGRPMLWFKPVHCVFCVYVHCRDLCHSP